MRSILLPMVVASATFAIPAVAATVSIDSFGSDLFVIAPSGGSEASTNSVADASAFGGTRTIAAERLSPTGSTNPARNVFAYSDSFDGTGGVSVGTGTTGIASFSWSAAATDLTDLGSNDGIRLGIVSVDSLVNFALTLNGITVSKATSSAGDLDFLFTDFAALDATSISTVSLELSGDPAFDASFSFIEATNVSAVPLPAGGLLLLGGLGALGFTRRKRG